jgi:hypothetical protein
MTELLIRPLYCNTVWVPHSRDAFVFVARVGAHVANLLGRINSLMLFYAGLQNYTNSSCAVPLPSA